MAKKIKFVQVAVSQVVKQMSLGTVVMSDLICGVADDGIIYRYDASSDSWDALGVVEKERKDKAPGYIP